MITAAGIDRELVPAATHAGFPRSETLCPTARLSRDFAHRDLTHARYLRNRVGDWCSRCQDRRKLPTLTSPSSPGGDRRIGLMYYPNNAAITGNAAHD